MFTQPAMQIDVGLHLSELFSVTNSLYSNNKTGILMTVLGQPVNIHRISCFIPRVTPLNLYNDVYAALFHANTEKT